MEKVETFYCYLLFALQEKVNIIFWFTMTKNLVLLKKHLKYKGNTQWVSVKISVKMF